MSDAVRADTDPAPVSGFAGLAVEILESIADGFYALDRDWRCVYANRHTLAKWGVGRDDIVGRVIWERFPELAGSDAERQLRAAVASGKPVAYETLSPLAGRWLSVRVAPLAGGLTCVYWRDIAESRRIRDALAEEAHTLETLNRTGALLAAELDLGRLVQAVTDAATELSGAAFGAFFYRHVDSDGESFVPSALSGLSRGVFAGFPPPRATALFGPIFHGEAIVRAADVASDPRYGQNPPNAGMPEGHVPVRSFLGAPVKSRSGEVLGGLLFGHPEPGIFSERAEQVVAGIAAQAAVAIDNARLYQASIREISARISAEAALTRLNAELGDRVTAEVAARLKAEEALRQAQKMEVLGQLTGGVAHDFNNLLTVVVGNMEMLRWRLPEGADDLRRLTDAALRGAERGATLTRRLLAFSRHQPLEPKPVNLNELVTGMSDLFHRTLGESIAIETVLAKALWPVAIDGNQLESALLNLAVNARDAMPEGGTLTITTANVTLKPGSSVLPDRSAAGPYVMIGVADTGIGMQKETAERAFEPFFTTKEVGQGTGLGLSQVYGFVVQSGGLVRLESEWGRGTAVELYLPRIVAAPAQEAAVAPEVPTGTASETILVVEDDEDVRGYSTAALLELGYEVLEAADAEEALARLAEAPRIRLMFSDIGLPGGRDGMALAAEARIRHPALKILLTTGYARNAPPPDQVATGAVALLTKPFTYAALAAKIREALQGEEPE